MPAIVALKKDGEFAVVMHVYAKSAKSDLSPRESDAFSDLSGQLLKLSAADIKKLVDERGWKEIDHGEKERQDLSK